jgi:hypothetical protein
MEGFFSTILAFVAFDGIPLNVLSGGFIFYATFHTFPELLSDLVGFSSLVEKVVGRLLVVVLDPHSASLKWLVGGFKNKLWGFCQTFHF